MSLSTGLYTIFNVAGRSYMDLGHHLAGGLSANGEPKNRRPNPPTFTYLLVGTQIQGYTGRQSDSVYAYDQFWFIAKIPNSTNYTIYNLRTGTVVDLAHGSDTNGAKVQGWDRNLDPNDPTRHNQEWGITSDGSGAYIFLNAASGTCLELAGGNPADDTKVQGWEYQMGNPNQQWILSLRTTPNGTS